MDLRSSARLIGLLALAMVLGVFLLLSESTRAGSSLEAGDERVSSVQEIARARAAEARQAARERSLAEARPRAERPAPPEAERPAPPPDSPCEANVKIAAQNGLRLPDGWALHCPGPGLDWEGGTHWGVTCPYAECPEGQGPYISISNPTYYVVAHELCHANYGNDELMADRCAAEHGASLATSPYG